MSESLSKKRKIGDKRTQGIRQQSSEETPDQPGDAEAISSEDSISLPAMILSPVSSVEAPSLVDSPSMEDLEKNYTECVEIIRKAQDITKNEHLVESLTENKISDIYGKICLLWETLASGNQEKEYEIHSTPIQTSPGISKATSKVLNIISNEIQALRALEQRSEDSCKHSPSDPQPMEERNPQSIILPRRQESTESTSSASELLSLVDSAYTLELILKLIRYNQEQMVKITSGLSSGESAKDAKVAFHIEILKEIQICMLEEAETLKTRIDNFKKSENTSDKTGTPSNSASMESEDISVATEIQVISFSASGEVKDDDSFKTKIKKVFATSAPVQKEREITDVTAKEPSSLSDIEMKEIDPLPAQEMLDSPSAADKSQINQASHCSDESEAANRQKYHLQLELCVKSSRTDAGDAERSTGPCVTDDTLLSTPDEDTGKSISSIPWDSVSFHSSIADEPLDSETEETQL